MSARPEWLKVSAGNSPNRERVRQILEESSVRTVCIEASCPNAPECFSAGTATFLILGDRCTRNCGFCAIAKGEPRPVDPDEPRRVAQAVAKLSLEKTVVTSVTRDDLPDGGASIFASAVREIRHLRPSCDIELLIPDFNGDVDALRSLLDPQTGDSRIDVLAHNVETIPRLYPLVRPMAGYRLSLNLLAAVKAISPETITKSGLMVGLGERFDEVIELLYDLRLVGCDVVTIGQYLSPSSDHLAADRYWPPAEFAAVKLEAERMGFLEVIAGPLVRSSYKAAG